MARTAVTPTTLSANAVSSANPAGTTIDSTLVTNGVVISGVPLEELFLRVTNTAAATKVLTVQSGDDPPAEMQGQGDLTQTFAAGNGTPQVHYVGPLTSARFIQNGAEAGQVHVDFESGFTGTFEAFRIPRTA